MVRHSENRGWFCQELKTGRLAWEERRKFDRGSVTAADGRLYCLSEKGVLALIESSPRGWAEHGRLKLPKESQRRRPSGMVWTQPVIANGRLYLRDQEFVFCFELKP